MHTKEVKVSVDRRVELMSVIYRLAGNPEYNQPNVLSSYAKDADAHFAAFKDDPVVQLARKMRKEQGVSYDAPMTLAVHLTPGLEESEPFEKWPEGLDKRYTIKTVRQFIKLAREFAAESGFDDFCVKHDALYREAIKRMERLIRTEAHCEWFERYFGNQSGGEFSIILGMLNGPCCYGPHVMRGKMMESYCILGVWTQDKEGMPLFDKSHLPTIIHEFNHPFVTPLVLAHLEVFQKSGQKIYGQVQERMLRMAYGDWSTLIHESVVRACVVRYMQANSGPEAAKKQIQGEHKAGFEWVDKLSQFMADEYEPHRDKYVNLEAFISRLGEFFDKLAEEK